MRFEQACRDVQALRTRAQAGEIELAYLDEAGFAQVPPNRSAWTVQGQQHGIDAARGKRLNVMGALLSSGGLSARIRGAVLPPTFSLPFWACYASTWESRLPSFLIMRAFTLHRTFSLI